MKCVEAHSAACDFQSCLHTEQHNHVHVQTLTIEQQNVELDGVPGINYNGSNSMATGCDNDIINDLNTIHDHSRTRHDLEDYNDAKEKCSRTSENCSETSFHEGIEVNCNSFKEECIDIEEDKWENFIKSEIFDTNTDLLESIKTELDTESNVAAMQSEYNDASAVVNDTVHEHSRTRHDLEDYNDAKGKCSTTSETCSVTSFHDGIEVNCDGFKEESIDIEEHKWESFIKNEIFDTSTDAEISCNLQQWSDFDSNDLLESVKTELDTESNVAAMQSEYNDASAVINDITADRSPLPEPANSDDFEEYNESSRKNSTKSSGLLGQYNKLAPMNYNANVENCNSSTTSAESFTKQGNWVTKSQVGVVSMEPNNSCSVGLLQQRKVNVTKIADRGNIHSIKRRFKSSIKSHSRINENKQMLNNCRQKEKNINEKIVAKSERQSELLQDCRMVLTRMDVMSSMETEVKKSSHLKCDMNIKSNNTAATEAEANLHSVIDLSPLHLKRSNTSALNSNNLSVQVKKQKLSITSKFLKTIGKKPYKCVQSDNACSEKDNLIKHMSNHSGEKLYKCDQCDYAGSRKDNLIVHMRKHTGEKPYKCDQCDNAFSRKCSLNRHMRNHRGEKPFKCYQCDNVYSRKGSLNRRNHRGEKPFKCDQCDYACCAKSDLLKHMRIHTGEKPYKCDQCDYACSRKYHLIVHMRKHTGEKPYKCDQCDYACSAKNNLLKHMRTHTGEKPYKCDR